MTARGAGAWAVLVAFVAGCAPGGSVHPAASPRPSLSRSAAPPTAPPVNFQGHRVGSRYVYATKQKGTHKVYVLRADTVNAVYNGTSTGRSNFTNPHVTFYGDGAKELIADAPAGTVVEKDKTVVMTGGVHARNQDGMTLVSDTLRYDDESQVVHGTGHVVVDFPHGEQLQGETVDWNLRNGQVNVRGAQ